jgi:anthranilate phosphoribosyltransferase
MLGTEHAFVVHGNGRLDEISLSGPTTVAEVREGSVRKYELTPESFRKRAAPHAAFRGGSSVGENAALIERIFEGAIESDEDRARRDIVIVNAAAALVAAGVAGDFRDSAEKAEKAIGTGLAAEKLRALRKYGRD